MQVGSIEWLIDKVDAGWTVKKMSDVSGVKEATIRTRLFKHNVRLTEKNRPIPWSKGKTKETSEGVRKSAEARRGIDFGYETNFERSEKISKTRIEIFGGEVIDKDGYRKVRVNRKYRHEHRIVAERILSRELDRTEIVHHMDENRTNNDPSNLIVCKRNVHSGLHAKMNVDSDLDQVAWLEEQGFWFIYLGDVNGEDKIH